MSLSIGVYEQIVNNLIRVKLDSIDTSQFFVGTKSISKIDAINLLCKYLQHLLEIAFANINEEGDSDKCSRFVNDIIINLGRDFNIEDSQENLIDAGRSILTAVVDKTRCVYPVIS